MLASVLGAASPYRALCLSLWQARQTRCTLPRESVCQRTFGPLRACLRLQTTCALRRTATAGSRAARDTLSGLDALVTRSAVCPSAWRSLYLRAASAWQGRQAL